MGKVYRTYVQSVMVYASETWAVRVEEEPRMERKENVMLRWMFGITLRDKVPTAVRDKIPLIELRRRLGIESVMEVITLRDKIPMGELRRRLGVEGVADVITFEG